MPRKLIPIRQVCDDYGLSDKTVRRKIKNGELDAYRCGPRLIKLDAEQVEAALMRLANKPHDIESTVARIVASAPPLTDDQRERICALLRAGAHGGAA